MSAGGKTKRRASASLAVAGLVLVGGLMLGWPLGIAVLAGVLGLVVAASTSVLTWGAGEWLDWLFTRVCPWLAHRLWLWRAGLLPLWLGACAALAGWMLPSSWWPVPVALGAVTAGVLWLAGERLAEPAQHAWLALVPSALDDGRKGVLDRAAERGYLATLLLGGGTWIAARMWWGWTEPIRWALLAEVVAYGAPWWFHRGFRRRRPLSKWARRWKRVEGNETLKEWHGSRVTAVEGNRRATTLVVRLRAGMTIKKVGGDSLSVAAALGLRPGAVTVAVDKSAAARVRVRVVPRDPWRGVLLHPLPGVGTLSLEDLPRPRVGDYEDATDCTMKLQQHMLVVGQTGSGKSVWLEALLAWILQYKHARVVAADLANGATLGIWRDVFAAPLATDEHAALQLLGGVFREIERREALLSRRKMAGELIDVLPADAANPALWVIIDEFPDLIKAAKMAGLDVVTLLERLANKARKVNVWLVLGAQNPTTNDVGSTELRGALTGVVGLALSERQSMTLWGTMRQLGWDSQPLRTGTFLLADRDLEHQEPRVAKGLWLPPAARLQLIREASAADRQLPAAGRAALRGVDAADPLAAARPQIGAVPDMRKGRGAHRDDVPPLSPRLDDLVHAELPEADGPTVQVTAIAEQLDVSRDQVNRALRRLERAGRVTLIGRGRWERLAEDVVEVPR